MANYRSRKHVLLLYPEDVKHVACLEKIKQGYDYVGILHDKDLDENGILKKPHWHVVISFKNGTWQNALADDFGITPNYIQQVRNEQATLEYLIHFNEEEKFQYPFEEIFGTTSFKNKLKKHIESDELTEGDKVIELIEFIENADKHISVTSFARYCAMAGRWDVFRRSGSIFIKMIDEKNKTVVS